MAKNKKSILELNISFGGVSPLQKSIFIKNLSLMLKSGLDIVESLEIIADQTTGSFKGIVEEVLEAVSAGNSLSSAFKKHPKVFSALVINTTMAGESAGTMAENLGNIAEHLRHDYDLVSKIKSAMVYPMILVIGATLLGLVMAFVVLPKIIPLFESLKVDLPASTQFLIASTKFLEKHTIGLLLGIVAGVIAIYYLLKQDFVKPYTDYLLLKIPIINKISVNSNLSSFCNTLGTLLKSGLIIDEALNISKEVVSNHYFKKCLNDITTRTLQGSKLSDNLARYDNIFSKMVIGMVRVGEKSGNLEESLFHLGSFYESEVDIATRSLATAVEPVLLLGMGVFVGFLAISIITPIYKLTSSVNK